MLTSKDANPSQRELRLRAIRQWWDESRTDAHALAAVLRLLAAESLDEPVLAGLLNDLAEHVPATGTNAPR